MGLREIIDRIVLSVDRVYDRRIKAASNVTGYGVGHAHGHGSSHEQPDHAHSRAVEQGEDDAAEPTPESAAISS